MTRTNSVPHARRVRADGMLVAREMAGSIAALVQSLAYVLRGGKYEPRDRERPRWPAANRPRCLS
jgi:hypothetical protein